MYLDYNTEHYKHIETLNHRKNARLNIGELIKSGSKFECVTGKTTLSQYSVEQRLKTKMHLDNFKGKAEDKKSSKDREPSKDRESLSKTQTSSTGSSDICHTKYNNKNKHNDSDDHKENVKQKIC